MAKMVATANLDYALERRRIQGRPSRFPAESTTASSRYCQENCLFWPWRFAMDYPGFGLSDGLHGYIPSFDDLVDDVVEQFSNVKEKSKFKRPSKFFLFGQSMGGAVALKVHLKNPQLWDGAILLAPMCKGLSPLLILHGEADKVTDPSVSKALFEKAKCSDKKLYLYEDAYHSLLEGESDEMIFRVLIDIVSWIDEHCPKNVVFLD
ncbi:hypothetical protein HPP92_006072 [Vanilla planifolia]|uniref:Serine aminopeptidase S33 domain-containing protein n=1 Tax=Vanilla planifolia TaxID=51239 RepID=A0A835S013_VANPL|nr:hypothetical protein HPP92_006072 [Vanilla planifolia]